jgi:high affinity Mn2+ porin
MTTPSLLAARFRALLAVPLVAWPVLAAADDAPPPDDAGEQQWAVHGQSTYTQQLQPAFRSPYQGPQSLSSAANGRETFDLTLFAGVRPWQGGEIWINPEIDQGYGLGNSFGVAGYLSGEAYKVGETDPYYRMARGFFRQTIDLGGETKSIEPDLNQLGGSETANRVVITIGKYSVVDIFDNNKYAHDPRGDFMNWSVIDAGTFDYAADAWGATYGAAAEWYQDWWTVRVGVFDMSAMPNTSHLSLPLFQQTQFDAELEQRHVLWGQPGALKLLYWLDRGQLGAYSDALALAAATGTAPATASVRRYRSKYGLVLNLEQQVMPDLGVFARIGWTQGGIEEDDFTDIDQTLQIGASLTGSRWGRPDDTVGVAAVANQISRAESSATANCRWPHPNRYWKPIIATPRSLSPRSRPTTSWSTTRPTTASAARCPSSPSACTRSSDGAQYVRQKNSAVTMALNSTTNTRSARAGR